MKNFDVTFEESNQAFDAQFDPSRGSGGGGSVASVNGKTGAVVLDAGDLEYDGTETYDSGTVGDEISEVKSALNDKLSKPATPGTSGQVLTSDGNGGQSWQTPQSGSSVSPYTSNPSALGNASPGSSADYARGDHVHPLTGIQTTAIADAGGYFTTDTVEGALQQLGATVDGIETLLAAI